MKGMSCDGIIANSVHIYSTASDIGGTLMGQTIINGNVDNGSILFRGTPGEMEFLSATEGIITSSGTVSGKIDGIFIPSTPATAEVNLANGTPDKAGATIKTSSGKTYMNTGLLPLDMGVVTVSP